MHVDQPTIRAAARAEQPGDQALKAICLTNNDAGELMQRRVIELTLQQLCRATQTAERVANFMRQLTQHALTDAPLREQRALTIELMTGCHVEQLNQHMAGRAFVPRADARGQLELADIMMKCGDVQCLAKTALQFAGTLTKFGRFFEARQ